MIQFSKLALPAAFVSVAVLGIFTARAGFTDVTQTPNAANAGIKKSLAQQIGGGRGDVFTPETSAFIIARDPVRAIARGRQLFQRKFTIAEGFGPRTTDGVGDIAAHGSIGAGLVDSCAGCHARPHGSAGFGGDVFTRPDSRDAPHLFGLGLQEMLADEITQELRAIRDNAIANAPVVGVALTAKGISYGFLSVDGLGNVDTSLVEGVDEDLRVRPFFAQGATISIREFVVGAFNAEMGLGSPDPDLAAAAAGSLITTPAGMILDGSTDVIEAPPAASVHDDPDEDGVTNEVPTSIVDFMEFYLFNYFKPAKHRQDSWTLTGRIRFLQIGCGDCHVPDLLINEDRRVADAETEFDEVNGGHNRLFSTASLLLDAVDDHSGHPTLKSPTGASFLVRDIFTDFKRHDLGAGLHERNFDNSVQTEFMTEPLWGVGSTPPYGHDGKSINLEEIILRHDGEAAQSRDRFADLNDEQRRRVLAFLESLVLFPPPDTASNLDPGDPSHPEYPLVAHGSVDLSVLFNDPADKE